MATIGIWGKGGKKADEMGPSPSSRVTEVTRLQQVCVILPQDSFRTASTMIMLLFPHDLGSLGRYFRYMPNSQNAL